MNPMISSQKMVFDRIEREYTVNPRMRQLFDRARGAAERKQFFAALFGRSRRLLALDDATANTTIKARYDAGPRTVAMNAIRGTVDKADDFDIDFLPCGDRTEERWVRLATLMRRGEDLPPVELIELDGEYFVLDGHHRISAARALGYGYIDAVVTVWQAA
jgi:uncharacterized ParB-like nuclease family protein